MLGMTVAEKVRRNRKITITTSATAKQQFESTSLTEARIVCRAVCQDRHVDGRRAELLSWRQTGFDAIHHLNDVRSRLALDVEIMAGESFIQAACLVFSAPSTILAMSESMTGEPLRKATTIER